MKSCYSARKNICAYIDNELDRKEKLSFEEHIAVCAECKRELDEMSRVIRLCAGLPQHELPEGFQAELHEKLIAVAVRRKENSADVRHRKSFLLTRTFASVAAGLLLIFLAGSYMKIWNGFPAISMKSSMQSADTAMAAPAESPVAMENYGADDSAAAAEGETIADQNLRAFSVPAVGAGKRENGREPDAQNRDRSVYISGAPETDTISNKLSFITIIADDPKLQAETVRSLAEGNNGETPEERQAEFMGNADMEYEAAAEYPAGLEYSEATVYSAGVESIASATLKSANNTASDQTQIILQYIFPMTHYDQFVTVLNDSFGTANVQMGAFVSEDLTDTLEGMVNESGEIDTRIQKLKKEDSVINADEVYELNRQKGKVDKQIEAVRLGSDFVTVTIYINKK